MSGTCWLNNFFHNFDFVGCFGETAFCKNSQTSMLKRMQRSASVDFYFSHSKNISEGELDSNWHLKFLYFIIDVTIFTISNFTLLIGSPAGLGRFFDWHLSNLREQFHLSLTTLGLASTACLGHLSKTKPLFDTILEFFGVFTIKEKKVQD